ncbi:GNAT family N-acetyltransferase [Pseudomonas mosselii]|uniref:GNAT family N-acetyltransferase n=1 Tax=Pseudomonas mosselii TaxID=78327 RepID=UPI000BB47C80|nr:GNAT family N-acetyltransferase [Pseudomonas mosselii]ATB66089.1 GNAT family N-acetyltransferase [Pseudomonas mosselii]MDH1103181.1 GNAT family N-acetyltransferase [Pseudomonas mosselii]UVN43831.1 GNAT family N-acetyltransferase [Pseudomonas mosselii]
MSISEVSLRPIVDVDRAFLRTLYGTTRAAEMALLPWPQAAIDVFLDQQFQAQHDYYQAQFADADFFIIELAGEPIGRVYLHWTDSHVQFIDMALLPAWCGRGIGSRLLVQWLAQADADGLSAGLHVTPHNPALRLYQRCGFEVVGETGLSLRMRRAALTTAIRA